MASRATISFLRALHQKKFRLQENAFLAEGPRLVEEVLRSKYSVQKIFSTAQWLAPEDINLPENEFLTQKELEQVSALHTPNKVLAVVTIPEQKPLTVIPSSGLHLMIDQVSDPGNLGTILRIADWFGFEKIVCSPDTVELYNPKVVQSTMGSLFRMDVTYQSLSGLLIENAETVNLPVFASVMNGQSIYERPLAASGWIILGNESRGIQPVLKPFVTESILIPASSPSGLHAESLNVAVAAGIICAEFRRQFPLK
jgi:RNA methyltransferase, TrmH family